MGIAFFSATYPLLHYATLIGTLKSRKESKWCEISTEKQAQSLSPGIPRMLEKCKALNGQNLWTKPWLRITQTILGMNNSLKKF